MDRITQEQRSRNMSRVHGKDTKPEIIVRKYLYANGLRYRLHAKLPGKPDIIIKKKTTAIFVNGCFWHAHNCKRFNLPQTNSDFWKAKIESNVMRDRKNHLRLKEDGWHVLTIWECQLGKDRDTTLRSLRDALMGYR